MPSTVTSTDAPESIAEEVEALVTPFPTPQAIEEVDQSSLGGTPAKGDAFYFVSLCYLSMQIKSNFCFVLELLGLYIFHQGIQI